MKTLKNTLTSIAEENKIRYIMRRNKIEAAYKESNMDLDPVVDCKGRLHAPCDGYMLPASILNFVEGYDDQVFGKGEFLPMPKFEEDEFIFNQTSYPDGHQSRVLVNFTEEEHEMLEALSAETKTFGVSFGKSWVKNGSTHAYAYVCSRSKRVVDEIVNYFTVIANKKADELKAKREAEKSVAGVAPTGRIVVRGTVVSVKIYENYYGMTEKMMVKLENGSTVFGTVPSKISVNNGDIVEFTATFKHAEDDNKHAFYTRPSKAKLCE